MTTRKLKNAAGVVCAELRGSVLYRRTNRGRDEWVPFRRYLYDRTRVTRFGSFSHVPHPCNTPWSRAQLAAIAAWLQLCGYVPGGSSWRFVQWALAARGDNPQAWIARKLAGNGGASLARLLLRQWPAAMTALAGQNGDPVTLLQSGWAASQIGLSASTRKAILAAIPEGPVKVYLYNAKGWGSARPRTLASLAAAQQYVAQCKVHGLWEKGTHAKAFTRNGQEREYT